MGPAIERTALRATAAMRSGETSAAQLYQETIARIQPRDGALNAVVRDFERARQAAVALDARLAGGFDSPLRGVLAELFGDADFHADRLARAAGY